MPARIGDRPALAAAALFGCTLALATLSVGLFGVLRLTRQFPAAAASPALLVPFLLPVLALALEAGALVAFSASAFLVCRRVTRATDPARWGALALSFVLLLGVLGVAEALPRGTERPGAFANELIESARQSCSAGGSVPVPLLGLVIRCDQGARIEGPMPGVPRVQVAMKSLQFSDDLRRVHIEDLDLTARRWLSVRLRARSAHVAGLSPWTRSPRLSPLVRCALLGGIGLALGLALGALWRWPSPDAPRPRWQRVLQVVLAGLPGLAAAAVVISLDQEQAAPEAYSWALGAALASAGLLALARWRAPKIFSSFSSF